MRSRDAQHEASGREDAVVRAQYGCAQPPDPIGTVSFYVAYRHSRHLQGSESLPPSMYYIDLAAVLAGVASVMRHGVPQRRDTFPNALK